MVKKRGWPIDQVKFASRIFYLIVFSHEAHQEEDIHTTPWYMKRKFMYSICWELAFDVLSPFNMLLVWIDLPFYAIVLETSTHSASAHTCTTCKKHLSTS